MNKDFINNYNDCGKCYYRIHMSRIVCEQGNMNIIKFLFEMNGIHEKGLFECIYGVSQKKVEFLNDCFGAACKGGNMDVVNLMISKGANDWNWGLFGACRGGHMNIVELMISKGATYYKNSGLKNACIGGHIEIVELMISKGADNWILGLDGACEGGHMDIVKFMISKGAKNWNCGLKNACLGGHVEIAKLMISKGANNLVNAFYSACQGGHMNTIEFMISKGMNDWELGLDGACEGGYIDAIKLMISKGACSSSVKHEFPFYNKKARYYNDIYDIYKRHELSEYYTILYWTLIYNSYNVHKCIVQRDLIPSLLKILYF